MRLVFDGIGEVIVVVFDLWRMNIEGGGIEKAAGSLLDGRSMCMCIYRIIIFIVGGIPYSFRSHWSSRAWYQ